MKYTKMILFGIVLLAFALMFEAFAPVAAGGFALAMVPVGGPVATIEAKVWYKSWTNWFNLVAVLAAFLDEAVKEGLLPDQWTEYVLMFVGAVNIFLRFRTDRPVALTSGKEQQVKKAA